MRAALAPLDQFFAVGEMTKWAIFVPCEKGWLPGNKNKAVASDDFYLLDLLTSDVHRQWMHAQKGTLKGDIAYTHDTIFETFPFPQIVAPAQVQQIRQAMITINDYRNEVMVARNWGITDLHNAYFHEPAGRLAEREAAGEKVVGPWAPA
jgi:hypothetical protein